MRRALPAGFKPFEQFKSFKLFFEVPNGLNVAKRLNGAQR